MKLFLENDKSGKGFVFSLDSLVAVTLVVSAAFLFVSLQQNSSLGISQTPVLVEDTLAALEGSGFIVQTIDSNAPTVSAQLLRQQILGVLPSGFDANVSVSSYTIDSRQCALLQTFSACFPDANKITGSFSGLAPAKDSGHQL